MTIMFNRFGILPAFDEQTRRNSAPRHAVKTGRVLGTLKLRTQEVCGSCIRYGKPEK